MSNISKPTIPELNKCLKELVKWQQFALYLPGIDHTTIKIIKENERDDVVEQKIAVYDKWLQIYPNASWNDVINALETAEENTIAKQLREKHSISETAKMTSQYHDSPVMSPSGQSQPEKIFVSEEIVSELDTLQRSFIGLTGDVKMGVERQLENGVENNIKLLTRDLQEERAFPIPSLRSVTTSDELFEAIHPHYNFLNCYLIVSIALRFLSREIAEKASKYKEKVGKFMKTTKIRSLQDTLKRYSQMFFEPSSMKRVEIVVENEWEIQSLWLVRNLVVTLFPVRHPDELPWYDIVPGSVVMTFIALEHMTPSLIKSSRKRIQFMRLIGVISLKVGDELIWKKTGSGSKKQFTFEDSLIQAALVNNIEAVQFLLRNTQVNVNAKNTTNALINAFDQEIFWDQSTVKSFFKHDRRLFSALFKDVMHEFQHIQVDNYLSSSFLVADDDDDDIHPRYNFLNGRVLAGLAYQLPEHLSTRVKQYQAIIDGITKRKSLLIHFSSSLEKYFPTPFPDSIEVILSLHSVWRACSVWYVEQLGQLIFTPTLFHKLQWFRVDASEESLRVVLLADKEIMDSFAKECFGKNELISLLGVLCIQVDDTVVIRNYYDNGFTFDEAIELAKAMGNDKVSDLLLQIQQSPVDFNRFRDPDNNNNHQFLPDPDSTPLMIACCSNNSQLVQLLLDHNADPNVQSRNSYTALMYSTGNSKIFQMLLDRGADIKAHSFLNETVLYFACWVGNVKVVKTILATNRDLVNVAANNGHTPLIIASRFGYHVEIVGMLLQAEADPNVQNTEGWTALAFASRYGHSEIVRILLQAKANVHMQTTEAWTALAFASQYGHVETVRMLLQEKANINIQSTEGWTPLMSASRHGHLEIVKMLLQAKADPNFQTDSGWTALHLAGLEGHTEIVEMLLQANADTNIENNKGLTALHVASHYGRMEIVQTLLQAKADVGMEKDN